GDQGHDLIKLQQGIHHFFKIVELSKASDRCQIGIALVLVRECGGHPDGSAVGDLRHYCHYIVGDRLFHADSSMAPINCSLTLSGTVAIETTVCRTFKWPYSSRVRSEPANTTASFRSAIAPKVPE